MDLLSSQDWAEFRSAIHDVTDTFMKLPVTYIQRRIRSLPGFHENRANDLLQTNYNLLALKVPESKDASQANVNQYPKGFIDVSEGYFLFSYPDLLAHNPPLIDSEGSPVFIANKDSFFSNGKEVTIIGVNLVGPSENDFQLVKVYYKNQMTNSALAPINTVEPEITGTPAVGQVLNVSQGTWNSQTAIAYTYQWKSNSVDIVGATDNNYTVLIGDSGTSISCIVTATNEQGAIFAVSNSLLIT